MSDKIEGPLGFWTYPLLNTIIAVSGGNDDTTSTETAKVIRDSNGEVQEVVVIKE